MVLLILYILAVFLIAVIIYGVVGFFLQPSFGARCGWQCIYMPLPRVQP